MGTDPPASLFQQTQTPQQLFVHNNNNYRSSQHQHPKLKYLDVWYEVNEPITKLNCSLRVNRDQHVVWHRKYDKLGVHVLTIGSETFISDLRIRPVKEEFSTKILPAVGNRKSEHLMPKLTEYDPANGIYDESKYTWNLEIRKLRKDDSALYYCVLNSENAYGQIYKLNVMGTFYIYIYSIFWLNILFEIIVELISLVVRFSFILLDLQ
jgi:hypothetical protein